MNRLACEDLLDAAQWLGISNPCAFDKRIPHTAQPILEQLCLKIWAGDLLLVEIKPKIAFQFEKCCIDAIKTINVILDSSKVLDKALLGSKLVLLLFPYLKKPDLTQLTANTVTQLNPFYN